MESSKPRKLLLREKQMLVYNYSARFRVLVAGRRFGKTQLALADVRGGEKDYQYRRFQAVPVSQGDSSRWRGRGKNSTAVSKSVLGKSS